MFSLHWTLEWRPVKVKLDVATTRGVFQRFPSSRDLGTGHMWKTSNPPALLLGKKPTKKHFAKNYSN